MKSPFPGLDPYLEARWGDVHQSLITYTRDAIQLNLPPDLRARVEERVFVETETELVRRIVPDVHVTHYPPARPSHSVLAETGGVAVAEPLVFLLEDETVTEGFIEIRERGGGKVITVIEFFSPANKTGGEGEKLYLQKQRELLHSDTNLVEIDLVRSGQRVIAFPEHRIPPQHRRDALVCVRCAWSERARELYVLPLRERLPAIAIPLRQTDRPVPSICKRCWTNATATAVTTTSTTRNRPFLRSLRKMQPGRKRCSNQPGNGSQKVSHNLPSALLSTYWLRLNSATTRK